MACYHCVVVVVVHGTLDHGMMHHDMWGHPHACGVEMVDVVRHGGIPMGYAMAAAPAGHAVIGLLESRLVQLAVQDVRSGICLSQSHPAESVLGLLVASHRMEFRRQAHQPGHPWLPGLREGMW